MNLQRSFVYAFEKTELGRSSTLFYGWHFTLLLHVYHGKAVSLLSSRQINTNDFQSSRLMAEMTHGLSGQETGALVFSRDYIIGLDKILIVRLPVKAK